MIFKKINEDFDFGSVDIQSSAASDYNQTPELVRTVTNANVDPLVILNGLFKCKTPRAAAKYQYTEDKIGRIYCSRELQILSKNQTTYVGSSSYYNNLSDRDKLLLKKAGFTYHSVIYGRWPGREDGYQNPDVQEEWAEALCKTIVPFENHPFNKDNFTFSIDYFMSPDNGLVVITKMYYYHPGLNFWRCPNIIIMFTGEVIYQVDEVSKNDAKEGHAESMDYSKTIGFCNALVKRTGQISIGRPSAQYLEPVMLPSGNLVYIVNIEDCLGNCAWMTLQPDVNLDTFTDTRFMTFHNHLTSWLFSAQKCNLRSAITNLVHKYNKNLESIINAYKSTDGTWAVYFITDKKVVEKLLGQEIANKFNDNLTYRYWRHGSPHPVYIFFFITDKGMELYNAFKAKKINLTGIKSGKQPSE